MAGSEAADSRGVSETMGVVTLILLTVLVTASVGISVIVVADEEGPDASFRFDFLDDQNALIITHDGGRELQAGNLYLDGPDNNVTWAQVARVEEDQMVSSGDVIQVSASSAYGSGVTERDSINVVYTPSEGNSTVLATWPEDGGGEGPTLDDGEPA